MTLTRTIPVALGDRSYDVIVGAGLLDEAGALIAAFLKRARVFVVADETVWSLYGERLAQGLSRLASPTSSFARHLGRRARALPGWSACAKACSRMASNALI